MGQIKYDFPLASLTSWKIGGHTKIFYEPDNLAELAEFLPQLPANMPLFFLGSGSNVLIPDEGLDAVVICTRKLQAMQGFGLTVEAGATCAQLINYCLQNGLTGAEFLAGIPGTIGGALAMNAGAFGGQIWDLVTSVKTINRTGEIKTRTPQDYTIGYRQVIAPTEEWFIETELKLQLCDAKKIKEQIKEIIAKRHAKQPITEPSCGSVFRNPPNDSAARLIEACDLKGKQIGGAQISHKHANFIVNTGSAKAADVKQLITLIQTEVKNQFEIELIPEVKIL